MLNCLYISGSPVGVVLVLDSSGSIGPHNWQVTLKFATDVVIGLREKAKENLSKLKPWDYKKTVDHRNLEGIYFTLVRSVVCNCMLLLLVNSHLHSPWYNIGQGYHWEGLFESYIIGKLEISRFQIQLIAVSNFHRKCSSEHFSKMEDIC